MGGPRKPARKKAPVPPRAAPATSVATKAAPPAASPDEERPYIPATTVLPELTVKVFVIGILLSWIMASANAYLGLYAALTVSAAIPASVVSMAVLRFFKERNILENNLIQTTASAGESVVAGIVFVLPALLFVGYWKSIGIVETMLIAALGGSLGVLFTIPLRRAFIVDAKLQYPEGVATVAVLKSGEKGGSGGIGYIVAAGLVGSIYKLMQEGFALWKGTAEAAFKVGSGGVYAGLALSPALLGVGFIVGLPIAVLIFIGAVIQYGIAIPIYLAVNGWPTANPTYLEAADIFNGVRGVSTRFIGVGVMATGGVFTLIRLRGALARGFRSGLEAYRALRGGSDQRLRTERDMNMRTVLMILGVFTIPLTALFAYFLTGHFRDFGPYGVRIYESLLLGIVMLVVGFLFSAVAGYMAGVVGSSNNPISGVAIGTILFTAFLLLILQVPGDVGVASTILIGSTIASAAAIAGDNMQDLKAGHLLGGTPRNLQIMQMVGAIAAAIIIPFVLILLDRGYGIGGATLSAPQAGVMAAISQGIFGVGDRPIPWDMFWTGVGVAAFFIVFDYFLQWRKIPFRTPVLAIGVGLYIPFSSSAAIFMGGVAAFLAARALKRRNASSEEKERRTNLGVLFASGLIAGESIMGILVAGLLVAGHKNAAGDPVAPIAFFEYPTGAWEGLLVVAYIFFLIYWSVVRPQRKAPPKPE